MNAPAPAPTALRELISAPEITVAPGVYDALSALMVERAGFGAAYLSGASIAYTRFGRPDIGLVSYKEVADTLFAIRERVALPLIVDIDTGFGNALNVRRTVAEFQRLGADAVQMEDQSTPKRCGHLDEKRLVGGAEMAGKIRAAADARASGPTMIIARTDAIAVEGFDAALERGERYIDAGADILFVEAPQDRAQMEAVAARFGGRIPLMANMVEGGRTPLATAADLETMGYALVIFPGGTVRAVARLLADYYASLQAAGTTRPFRDRMYDFAELNTLLGTPEMLELGQRYDDEG